MEANNNPNQIITAGENNDLPEILISRLLTEKGLSLSTAESCTGGRIASRITSLPGSSSFYKGSVVAYDNSIKEALLNVSAETLKNKGAVSEETVVEMVKGAMERFKTDCAVVTSGISGPSGGTPEKPVGTIWIAAGCGNNIVTMKQEGDHGRINNMERAVDNALILLSKIVEKGKIAIIQ